MKKDVYAALITPFNDNQDINEKALENIIEYEIKKGVDGFYVTGSTGECFCLSVEERKRIMQLTAEIVNKRVDLIAHIGTIAERQASELGKAARKFGYTRISSVVPFYYDFSFESVRNYFNTISTESELPVIVYNIPATTGKTFSLDQLYELMSSDNVCGLKHTSMNFYQLERIKSSFPNKIVFNGRDECFLSGLCVGADGMIGSTANIIPQVYKRMIRMFLECDIAGALAEQKKANMAIELLQKVEFNSAIKYVLNRKNLSAGICRLPARRLNEEEIFYLEDKVIPFLESLS